ncbi:hypothetical protein WJR50_33640 [Catalinimonas sp. 4WD22]|uniref:hypothetical protein n=1 Tax=Catalinimonas locisalis TaxID=3133978 RepID=UPI003100D2F0
MTRRTCIGSIASPSLLLFSVNMRSLGNGAGVRLSPASEKEDRGRRIGSAKKIRPIRLLRSLNFRNAEKGIN